MPVRNRNFTGFAGSRHFKTHMPEAANHFLFYRQKFKTLHPAQEEMPAQSKKIEFKDYTQLITTRIPLPTAQLLFHTLFCGNRNRAYCSHNFMDTTSLASALHEQENAEMPMESALEQVYIRSKAVVSRRIAGETLIVPVRGKVGDLASIYSFNATGTLLWDALDSPQNLSSLIDAVEREYAVDHEQAAQDVKQFLKDTISVGLVEVREQVAMAAMNAAVQGDLHSVSSH
jgi:hypothetical protein